MEWSQTYPETEKLELAEDSGEYRESESDTENPKDEPTRRPDCNGGRLGFLPLVKDPRRGNAEPDAGGATTNVAP